MSKKHKQLILGYLVIGLAFAMFRRYVVGATVAPIVSVATAQDILTWPVGVFQSINIYRKTGSLQGGRVLLGPVQRVPTSVQSVGTIGA